MSSVKLASLDKIKKRLGIDPNGSVQRYFTERCYAYMDKYVPKDTGLLRQVVNLEIGRITYMMPYAKAQYYGIVHDSPVVNYTTPNTGSYWDKRMMTAHLGDIADEVERFIKK